MIQLTIYSKPGCHLCDDMKTVVQRVLRSRGGVSLEEIDVSADPALRERYEQEIPVLLLNGKKAAKYRITEAELENILDRRL